ncbi:NACHT domain-containing protein [Roseobacter sp. EG26]|uniref:NACHT domain-containing protein n=1 Tax=Roseobacter sp. EG26 TaxID=3412477 RepID=UPI003CE4940D
MGTRPYDFHKLHSETEFEDLVALVARKLIGHVIEFKQGPDEGRDARFVGKALDWPNEIGLQGKFVLQAKHTRSDTAICSASDFRTLVRGEYPKIQKLVGDGDCEYYLFFTSWQLPASVDRELIREIETELGVKKADILAYETLERIVDEHPEIQNWVYEHTEASRARSTQRWGRLVALLREQDALTRNVVGFMNDAFIGANQAANDLVSPQFRVFEGSEQTGEAIDFNGLVERLGRTQTPIVVEGPVGAGKSTAAKMLVQARIPDGDQIVDNYDQSNQWLPLFITGKTVQQSWDNFINLLDRATNETDHRNWCVIIDGLDEIDSAVLRLRLTDYAFSNLHPKKAELGFVFFTRPGVVDVPVSQPATILQIEGFDRTRQLQTAQLFSEGEQQAEDLLASLEKSLANEMLERPLFLALAFYLVTEGYGDFNSRYVLLDFFVDDVVKRASAKAGYAEIDLLRELSELALGTDQSVRLIPLRGADAVNAANERQQALTASGLIKRFKSSNQFTHEIFASFFKAKHLAEKFQPGRRVWEEIDPFHWGWETISLLCECWDARDEKLAECLKSLSRLSGEGFERAMELASTCHNIDDQTCYDFVAQIFGDYSESGVVPVAEPTLSKLAARSERARQYLIYMARGVEGAVFEGRVLSARCIRYFDRDQSLNLLSEIAADEHSYWNDRLSAAKELNELGAIAEALEAFRLISFEADEFQGRFEGAVFALELTGTEDDKSRLKDVIAEYKAGEDAYDDTLGRAVKLGFGEFAIPLIRTPIEKGLSDGWKKSHTGWLDLGSALWSCETLASIELAEEALRYYLQMFDLEEVGSRTMADILSSMETAGFKKEVEDLLKSPENLTKLRQKPDWFTIDFLKVHNLSEHSVEDTLSSLKASISDRHELHACLGYTDRLIADGRRDDVLQILRSISAQKLLPTHYEIQARCGERKLARESLLKGFRTWTADDKMWSARVLERIGFADDAIQILLSLSKSSDLLLGDRLGAAIEAYEIDGRHLAVVEGCLDQSREDDLLRAQLTEKLVRHGGGAAELAWRLISDKFSDENLSDECRFEFARVLQHTPVPIGFEEEEEELNDEIIGLLAHVSDPWLFAQCASRFSSTYGSGYQNSIIVDRLRKNPDLWSADLLRGVDYIEEITLPLEEEITNFSSSNRCDWPTAIHALQKLSKANPGGVAETKLRQLVFDTDVPLQWRLASMGVEWNQSRNNDVELFRRASSPLEDRKASAEKNNLIMGFSNDTTLTVECRLALIKNVEDEERRELLFGLAGETTECSDITRIELARDLARSSLEEDANQIVDLLLASETLGFWEAEKLLELCDELGREDAVQHICTSVSGTPEIILEWLEETSSIQALAVRIADVLCKDEALRVLMVLAKKNQFARWEHHSIPVAFAAIGASHRLPRRVTEVEKSFLRPDGVDWGGLYDADLRIIEGDVSTVSSLIEVLNAEIAPTSAKTIALRSLHKVPSNLFDDEAFEEALQGLLETTALNEPSVSELFGLGDLLIRINRLADVENVLKPLFAAELKRHEVIEFSKLLDRLGMKKQSRCQLEKMHRFDRFLRSEDFLYVQKEIGLDAATEKLTDFLNSEENDVFDKIDVTTDIAASIGVKSAFSYVDEIQEDKSLASSELIRLAEYSYEMGCLEVARSLFGKARDAKEPDHYWLADYANRYLGREAQAAEILEANLSEFDQTYFDQVGRLLADLRLSEPLERLNSMYESAKTSND